MSSLCFSLVDEDALVAAVAQARTRLVFVSPGVSKRLAEALVATWKRLPKATTVVLDVCAEVCRLGYGDVEGLKLLQDAAQELGSTVGHHPGFRIGVLVSDDATWVFSPTPLLIEAGATSTNQPNGIRIDKPPPQLAADLGLGPNGIADQAVGLDPVQPKQVDALAVDLKENPPLAFDVSRQIVVFNSQVEFVEFNVCGIQIDRRQVKIPSTLMGFASDAVSRTQLQASFTISPEPTLLEAKRKLDEEKNRITREFCHPMRGYGGSIILRSRKQAFLEAVECLRKQVQDFSKRLQADLHQIRRKSEQEIVSLLLPAVRRNPPAEWRNLIRPGSDDADIERLLKSAISDALADVMKMVEDIRVQTIFKGVTYECLNDPNFQILARNHFKGLNLHHEFKAASGSDPKTPGV